MKAMPQPPKLADQLLSWYCKEELLEDLQGDLYEFYLRNLKTKGRFRANVIYFIDVIKFFRPYTIRKFEFLNLLIHYVMIQSYIKTSGRNLLRNKLFSSINIVGLAVSMSVGLLMIGILRDVRSYDDFHENKDRIYRVVSRQEWNGNKSNDYMATTSLNAGKVLKENVAGVEDAVILGNGFSGDVKYDEKTIPLHGYWTDESFNRVFSFPMLQGNPSTALKQPYSIVLTQKAAYRIFGNDDALGKVLTFKEKDYTVTGVLHDVPAFSHVKFDMLGSLVTHEQQLDPSDEEAYAWDNIWSTWVYVLLPEGTSPTLVKSMLNDISAKQKYDDANTLIDLKLQPLKQIMVSESMGNQIGPVVGSTTVWIFAALAFTVILSACFNYTNLSIARSLRRTKEVGIRKVIGALKSHVVNQFMVESIMLSLCALVFAIVLFMIIKPHFLAIEPSLQQTLSLAVTPTLIGLFIAFALIVGMCAGVFPGIFFSKINAIQVFKDASGSRLLKKMTMRKILIVFQYCISIIFISAALIGYKQYHHFLSFDLGFTTENVLNISLQGANKDALKKDLAELPEVKGISECLLVTSVGNYWGTNMKYVKAPEDSSTVYYNTVDEHYLPLHGHQFIAGRNFTSKAAGAPETEVIVMQETLKRFNIFPDQPAKAIGEAVRIEGKELLIVGVLKDFHYGRANDRMGTREVVFRYSNDDAQLLNVKISSTDIMATHEKIAAIWKKHDKVHTLEAKFYDDQIDEAFTGLKAATKVAGVLAFLSICISSLGLLGMVVFTTETRVREISIRKVLGASEGKLLYLLAKGFMSLLGIAILIAVPIVMFFFDSILLPQVNNHAPLSILDIAIGVVAIVILAIVMITSQTLSVARANPAEVLKGE